LQIKEQRQHKRFAAELPVKLEAIASSRLRYFYARTKDISATSAFVYTKEAPYISDHMQFIINSIYSNKSTIASNYIKPLQDCKGTMVRSTSGGIVIRFNRPVKLFV